MNTGDCNWLIFPVNLQQFTVSGYFPAHYNWLIFPVNLQHLPLVKAMIVNYNWLIFPVNLQPCLLLGLRFVNYNWLIFPVNLQLEDQWDLFKNDYNWLIFPVNLQQSAPVQLHTHFFQDIFSYTKRRHFCRLAPYIFIKTFLASATVTQLLLLQQIWLYVLYSSPPM